MLIWQRYFLKEILKIYFLFIFCFFFLYVVMDYSAHMQDFMKDKKIAIFDLLQYYGLHFLKRATLVTPLATLIATIKVLTTLNTHHELVALQASGIRLKKLLMPFFLVAFLGTSFTYLNMEFFLPSSLNYIDKFQAQHMKHSYRGNRKEPIHVIHLEDDSKLVFQTYNSANNTFFDVFWLRSADDIWRIKQLTANPKNPQGECVDHLQRNAQGFLEKTESFPKRALPELKWKVDQINTGLIPIENRSLSELTHLHKQNKSTSYSTTEIKAQLIYKCIMPLLSLLVVLAAAPFCVRYARGLPLFLIYLLATFGFIAFYALMNAAVILGENDAIPALWAIVTPFALLAGLFGWKFAKT